MIENEATLSLVDPRDCVCRLRLVEYRGGWGGSPRRRRPRVHAAQPHAQQQAVLWLPQGPHENCNEQARWVGGGCLFSLHCYKYSMLFSRQGSLMLKFECLVRADPREGRPSRLPTSSAARRWAECDNRRHHVLEKIRPVRDVRCDQRPDRPCYTPWQPGGTYFRVFSDQWH